MTICNLLQFTKQAIWFQLTNPKQLTICSKITYWIRGFERKKRDLLS